MHRLLPHKLCNQIPNFYLCNIRIFNGYSQPLSSFIARDPGQLMTPFLFAFPHSDLFCRMNRILLVLTAILTLNACSNEVDLNAPPRDIWVVYGVLRQGEPVQYIRISRGYLPESDALEYGRDNDLSAKGLIVRLSGGGITYTATEVDSVLKDPADGTFYPYTTLYRIETSGTQALKYGQTYNLEITQPDQPDFALTAQTQIPNQIRFFRPTETPGPGTKRCLRQIDLDLETTIEFEDARAGGYEVRVILDYEENGTPKTVVYGPTSQFSEDVRCSASGICYRFSAQEVLRGFYNQMNPQPGNVYTYDVDDNNKCKDDPANLPTVFRFEVTAVDRYIASYRLANDPKFADFNSVRPEYTNITAPDGTDAYGVFGSESRSFARARLGPCSEALLRLNNTTRPLDCQDL
ncbi:MAG: hypothetical protein OHK0039_25830 [Bacteroidia bacterium]